MSRVVFKYSIAPVGYTTVWVGPDADVRHVGVSDGCGCVWVEHDAPPFESEKLLLYSAFTGDMLPDRIRYLGTLQMPEQNGHGLVVHVYEVIPDVPDVPADPAPTEDL